MNSNDKVELLIDRSVAAIEHFFVDVDEGVKLIAQDVVKSMGQILFLQAVDKLNFYINKYGAIDDIQLIDDNGIGKTDIRLPRFHKKAKGKYAINDIILYILQYDEYYHVVEFKGMNIVTRSADIKDKWFEKVLILYNTIVEVMKALSLIPFAKLVNEVNAIADVIDISDYRDRLISYTRVLPQIDFDSMLYKLTVSTLNMNDLEPLKLFNDFVANSSKEIQRAISNTKNYNYALESILSEFGRWLNARDVVSSSNFLYDFKDELMTKFDTLDLPDFLETVLRSATYIRDVKLEVETLHDEANKYAAAKISQLKTYVGADQIKNLEAYYGMISIIKNLSWNRPVKSLRRLLEYAVQKGFIRFDTSDVTTYAIFILLTNPGIVTDMIQAAFNMAIDTIIKLMDILIGKITSALAGLLSF